jgi:hypothetical protein
MTEPEVKPVNRRPQIFNEDDRIKAAMETLERENRSLKDLVVKLSKLVIQKVAGK